MQIWAAASMTAATLLTAGAGIVAPAAAAGEQWGLNARYVATSNGEWAKKNEIRYAQASIRSTWTIATECSYPTECTGTVHSDFGWSATIYKKSGVWYVKRVVENWEPCPDGTAFPGQQTFRFYPATADGLRLEVTSDTLYGEDITVGPAGACGISAPLFINMPFALVKLD